MRSSGWNPRGSRGASRLLMAACLALTACTERPREPWEHAPLPPEGIEVTRLATGPPLDIERIRFFSAELGEPRFYVALIPHGDTRDVYFLNHGWRDRPEDLLASLHVDRVYAEMLKAGEVKPAVIVLPDIRFPEAFRRNADKFPFSHSLVPVAEEVAQSVSRRYGVAFDPAHWSVGGFSFGGYLSLDIVRRYSGRFGSASVVSGFYDRDWTFWPTHPPSPGRLASRGRGKETAVVPGPMPRLLLACGTDDRFIGIMTELHEQLAAAGIPHQWKTAPGGHTWEYWSSMLKPMLLFAIGNPQAPVASDDRSASTVRRS